VYEPNVFGGIAVHFACKARQTLPEHAESVPQLESSGRGVFTHWPETQVSAVHASVWLQIPHWTVPPQPSGTDPQTTAPHVPVGLQSGCTVPATHDPPVGTVTPHAPQFDTSLDVSTQRPSQSVALASLQVGLPSTQSCPSGSAFPQAPQSSGSLAASHALDAATPASPPG